MKKQIYSILIILVFINCNSEAKKQSYTIDYLKTNKWCTMESAYQRCCEFNDNEMKVTKNGQSEATLNVLFEQKNNKLNSLLLWKVSNFNKEKAICENYRSDTKKI